MILGCLKIGKGFFSKQKRIKKRIFVLSIADLWIAGKYLNLESQPFKIVVLLKKEKQFCTA